MFLRTLVVCQLFISILVDAGHEGRAISCVCSTTHCLEHQMARCNTTGMCFSQYLDRGDGSDPVMRGCISSKTPLLCENRRPAIAGGSWPVLLCCNSNLCNRDVVPTLPPKTDEDLEVGHQEITDENDVEGLFNNRPADASSSSSGSKGEDWSPDSNSDEASIFSKKPRRSSHPRIMSPVYISVLVVGICSLVAIGIVAVIVLRRNNRFYADQYGAMERHDYLKPRRSSYPRDDPDLRMPFPPAAHGIYDNKLAGST